jgi:Domain of unknown function (DUF305)
MQMRVFAKNIIRVQTTEVKQMQDWLNLWYINHRTKGFYQPMMRDLDKLSGNELDQVFFEDMIEHHHMAVMMSQHLMMRTANVHLEVLTFARNVRDTQMQEIQTMRLWLRNWFGTTFLNSSMGCQMHQEVQASHLRQWLLPLKYDWQGVRGQSGQSFALSVHITDFQQAFSSNF